jgi:hypothetical protein
MADCVESGKSAGAPTLCGEHSVKRLTILVILADTWLSLLRISSQLVLLGAFQTHLARP